jgi:signal transduction histidine kinase
VETPAGPVEYLALPLHGSGDTLGIFVVAVFRDLQRAPFDDALDATALVAAAVLLMGSLLAWRAAESVLRPVRSVTQTARSITETDLSQRIAVEGNDELGKLAATFNGMLARLEAAFSGQRRFLNDVGHELKTPLTIVRGHLEVVQPHDRRQREAAHALVIDELARMSRIVNDLLLLAKAERPDFLRLATVDVARLTEELGTKVAALAERRWRVEATGRGMIVADRQRLTQALMQIAENAAKHTAAGEEIVLGSSVGMDAARFWVRDSGPGIPREEQQRIFERLTQGAGAHGAGLGLGLSIVRAIADAHGGRVELESSGAGTIFTLVVPLDPPEAKREA